MVAKEIVAPSVGAPPSTFVSAFQYTVHSLPESSLTVIILAELYTFETVPVIIFPDILSDFCAVSWARATVPRHTAITTHNARTRFMRPPFGKGRAAERSDSVGCLSGPAHGPRPATREGGWAGTSPGARDIAEEGVQDPCSARAIGISLAPRQDLHRGTGDLDLARS